MAINDKGKSVVFDRAKLDRLIMAHADAVAHGLGKYDSFEFDGDEYVVGYATYLIEYLNMQFPKH